MGLSLESAILRAFQGIGGGAIPSLAFMIMLQMVPTNKLTNVSNVVSAAFALATAAGPLVGGLISDHISWRWVFLIK